jgi:hypothetical protein
MVARSFDFARCHDQNFLVFFYQLAPLVFFLDDGKLDGYD